MPKQQQQAHNQRGPPRIPSIFFPKYNASIRPHLEYAIPLSLPVFPHAKKNVHKLAVKFVKELRNVPYEAALVENLKQDYK